MTRCRRRPKESLGLAVLGCVLGASPPAVAQTSGATPEPRVSWVDGVVTATSAAVTVGTLFVRVDVSQRYDKELLPFDQGVRGSSSASADSLSDALLMTGVVAPAALQLGQGLGTPTAERLLLYSETLSVTLALNSLTKVLVARPRPYVYSDHPRVALYGKAAGQDSRRSFFSGHAALGFAAAVSGSYLFSQTSTDQAARATVWGTELFLAGATASLRVRAGQHFPSDVFIGALVGTGVAAVAMHWHYQGREPRVLSATEWTVAATAPLLGAFAFALWPCDDNVVVPLAGQRTSSSGFAWTLAPSATDGTAGLSLLGVF